MAFGGLVENLDSATVHVLGVRFHRMTSRQVVEQLLFWVAEGSRRMMITAGPEFVMLTRRDPDLHRIARSADIITPDGIGVLWAARRAGHILQERVTGVEVTLGLLETANQRKQGLRVFLLGANQITLDQCLQNFRQQFPNCNFAGHPGYFSDAEWPSLLETVGEYAPNLWLVGLGQPRQEKLIFDNLKHLPPCIAIGVGGSIDVWGGAVKRAPKVLRNLNLEWLYRLLRQPKRWRRQLALPHFIWQVLKNAGDRM